MPIGRPPSGITKVAMNTQVPADVYTEFKAAVADAGLTITDVLTTFMRVYAGLNDDPLERRNAAIKADWDKFNAFWVNHDPQECFQTWAWYADAASQFKDAWPGKDGAIMANGEELHRQWHLRRMKKL